ncbi:hypothetical protein [Tuwongella immobilis]|uniref:Uncharacterized protein n=1 Tax=Tuwongella immobilis TaxID=692036 RepID=A0A6C2YQ60_9BACT|nr:hypothetical protein [Tuwongella immobilis]VIP03770.1 unnamed protein product [Tuwongella immobilis]VTS04908.1 unnamed protein product [Tuwongella immobilis]
MKLQRRLDRLAACLGRADAPLSLEDHLDSDWARFFSHWKDHPDQCPEPEFARALIEQDEAILHQILTNGTKDELDRIWERIDAMIQRGLSRQISDNLNKRNF